MKDRSVRRLKQQYRLLRDNWSKTLGDKRSRHVPYELLEDVSSCDAAERNKGLVSKYVRDGYLTALELAMEDIDTRLKQGGSGWVS